jgi:hypothetical protein
MYFKPPSDRQLRLAAEQRASGSNWIVVGKRLRRAAETVRKWPLLYPDRWKAAQIEAERSIAADAEGESVFILRQLLRADDDKTRWNAAKLLLHLRVDLVRLQLRAEAQNHSGPTADSIRMLVSLLESQTDEHLEKLVTADRERAAGTDSLAATTRQRVPRGRGRIGRSRGSGHVGRRKE